MANENRAGILFEFIDRTKEGFSSVRSQLDKVKGTALGVKSALVGVGTALAAGSFAAGIRNIIDQAEGLNKLAQRTGIATDTLSAYTYAAQLADVEQETLSSGLKKLAVNMTAAAGGSKEQAEVFKALGINLRGAGGDLKATDAVLKELADKFERFEDGPEKAALAVALFGKAGDQLIPFLNTLRQSEDEARKFAAIIGPEFAVRAEEFNDNLKRMKLASDAVSLTFANVLLPRLSDIAAEMVKTSRESGPFVAALQGIAKALGLMGTEAETAVDKLALLDKQIAQLDTRAVQTGADVQGAKRFAALKAEREELLKLYAERARMAALTAGAADEGAAFAFPKDRAPVVDRRDKSGAKTPFQQVLEQLQAERDKTDELTRAQEILASIERDRYGKLTAGQKQVLVALAEEIDAIKNKTIAEKNYVEALQREQEILDEARRLGNQSVLDRQKQLDSAVSGTKIARIEELRRQQALVEDEILSDRDPTGRFSERLAQIQDEITALGEKAKETNTIFQDFGLTLSSAFSAAIIEGQKLGDVLKGLGKDLLQLLAREVALKPIAKGASTIFEAIFKAIAPKAAGGPVAGGRPYMVGEVGPELFVPSSSGTIIPNGGFGGGVVQNINLTVNSSGDARADGQAILAAIVPVIKAVTRDTLVQESRVGGLLAPA